ncbi:hypothetical protein P8452_17089 [Trifolium repens]|nr:hypothetical protein P8452_17089 [Trifolium repens]
MEATVRALDEQKSELEKVIAALKKEEAEEEGLMAKNAGDDVAGDGTDDAVGDAAGTNVDDEGGDTEELESIQYIILESDNLSSLFPDASLNLGGFKLNVHILFAGHCPVLLGRKRLRF